MIATENADAANPMRRTFRARGELQAWLGEILLDSEKAALVRFLQPAG